MRIEIFATRIGALKGWRRIVLAFVLGLVSAFIFAPYYAAPILWIAFPILLWQLNGAITQRQAFLIGWLFGFGQFVFGFYWICISMFTDIARWWWAVPFACTILPALFALNTGFAAMLWWRMRATGLIRILLFAAWMTIAEWTRGHLFTGFPWNLTAYTWVAYLPLLQGFSILGAYGLGFITIAAASMPALFGMKSYPVQNARIYSFAGVAVLAALALWGWQRVPKGPVETTTSVVRLVQPNIAEMVKQDHTARDNQFVTLLKLSHQAPVGPTPNIVVWPETASPYPLDLKPQIPRTISLSLPPTATGLIGTVRFESAGDKWHAYNSVEIVNHKGTVLGHYDKTHLVPYGEYMPFRDILHLGAIAVADDLMPGDGPTTLVAPGVPPFSALICYEAIFPERIVDPTNRPQWLLQITNDAWFGDSSGPYQHLAMARARAVEQGLPLMRAANTGISAAVDPYGRILALLPVAASGVLDTPLPEALVQAPFYARYGDMVFFLMLSVVFCAWFGLLQRQVGEFFLN